MIIFRPGKIDERKEASEVIHSHSPSSSRSSFSLSQSLSPPQPPPPLLIIMPHRKLFWWIQPAPIPTGDPILSPEVKANPFSKAVFSWCTGLLNVGYSRILVAEGDWSELVDNQLHTHPSSAICRPPSPRHPSTLSNDRIPPRAKLLRSSPSFKTTSIPSSERLHSTHAIVFHTIRRWK